MSEITARAVREMTAFYSKTSRVRVHDINHFLKVWGFARTIGLSEGLDPKTQKILELAAIAHDIACPLCREKYGSTNGKYQETEGAPMVEAFLCGTGLSAAQIARVKYLVGHHHTFTDIDGIDYQILLEADYLANASENGYGNDSIENFLNKIAKTEAGKQLIRSVFCLN